MKIVGRTNRQRGIVENEPYTKEELEIAHAILRYLSKNPDAGNTLEGIAEWWLLKERIDRGVTVIKRALSYLMLQGLVIEKKIENRKGWFQINKKTKRDIWDYRNLKKEKIF